MSVKQGHLQKMALTKDHIFPASRTSSKKNNVVPCCRECNQKKADKEPTDYMLRRAKAAHIAACALMLADKHMDALVEYQLSAREHKITQRLQKEEHNVPEHLP
jgi:CRISPR/Cas system Type II protein with McrA/HNH and RuvC-like nuclease domain